MSRQGNPKRIECVCGAVIRGSSDWELLEQARLHIQDAHAQFGEPPPAADVLAMASDVEADDGNADASNLSGIDPKEQNQCGT